MMIESKARSLRQHPTPSEFDLQQHARNRDAFIVESRRLHYNVHDYAAISALPGPRRWYDEHDVRRGRRQ